MLNTPSKKEITNVIGINDCHMTTTDSECSLDFIRKSWKPTENSINTIHKNSEDCLRICQKVFFVRLK